jgi:hypothetical protein
MELVVGLNILCSGYLVRYPLGGHSWHHLQYLVGFQRLGHRVSFFEDHGWPNSCYDPIKADMTSDPSYGIDYIRCLLRPHGLADRWCYLAEDGTSYGMSREQLADACRECDVYVNLSNINWIPELKLCRRRVLIDTDPVFTQIGAFGMGGPFGRYHSLFTYGENVHGPNCEMPDGGARWFPTRQPVVMDLWEAEAGDSSAPFTTVASWSNFGDREYRGRVYGHKNREFEPYFSLPTEVDEPMEVAIDVPSDVRQRLSDGGWRLRDPLEVTLSPQAYQAYLAASRAEFSVAKHAYVTTRSGWFSDRSSAYLASGRPIIVQDTGFSDFLPCGEGLLAFTTPREAKASIRRLTKDYERHRTAARKLIEAYFEASDVLTALLERCI